jgi:hypothetical protein
LDWAKRLTGWARAGGFGSFLLVDGQAESLTYLFGTWGGLACDSRDKMIR